MANIITIIAPVFLIMVLGYGLGKTRLFPENAPTTLINFVWYVAIPALLFRSLASKDLPQLNELGFVGAYYGSLFLVYALSVFLARWLLKLSAAEGGIFALVTCFANGVFIGVPVLEGLYGDEGIRLLLVLLSFHSLTLLPVTTILVEKALNRPGEDSTTTKILNSIQQNPILIALACGLLWSALSLPFPLWLDRVLELPASAAAPIGLFVVGLALANVRIAGNIQHAFIAVCLKLLLLPAIVFSVTEFVLGLPEMWVGTATILAALPSGMTGYSIASQYGVGERRAATTVLMSTALSVITLTVILLLLQAGL